MNRIHLIKKERKEKKNRNLISMCAKGKVTYYLEIGTTKTEVFVYLSRFHKTQMKK